MLISFVNDTEVIVCTQEQEEHLLEDYFPETGRDVQDYVRTEHENDVVEAFTSLTTA